MCCTDPPDTRTRAVDRFTLLRRAGLRQEVDLGQELPRWHPGQTDTGVDRARTARLLARRGAYVMGRNLYAPDRGDWADAAGGEMWRGWWGEDPPYHAPVFVLTHYPHDPVEME